MSTSLVIRAIVAATVLSVAPAIAGAQAPQTKPCKDGTSELALDIRVLGTWGRRYDACGGTGTRLRKPSTRPRNPFRLVRRAPSTRNRRRTRNQKRRPITPKPSIMNRARPRRSRTRDVVDGCPGATRKRRSRPQRRRQQHKPLLVFPSPSVPTDNPASISWPLPNAASLVPRRGNNLAYGSVFDYLRVLQVLNHGGDVLRGAILAHLPLSLDAIDSHVDTDDGAHLPFDVVAGRVAYRPGCRPSGFVRRDELLEVAREEFLVGGETRFAVDMHGNVVPGRHDLPCSLWTRTRWVIYASGPVKIPAPACSERLRRRAAPCDRRSPWRCGHGARHGRRQRDEPPTGCVTRRAHRWRPL